MSEQTANKEVLDLLYNCPKAGIEVHLKVKAKYKKGLFGKKYVDQVIKRCDLLSQGGCTIKIDPAATSSCPAVAKANKNGLK